MSYLILHFYVQNPYPNNIHDTSLPCRYVIMQIRVIKRVGKENLFLRILKLCLLSCQELLTGPTVFFLDSAANFVAEVHEGGGIAYCNNLMENMLTREPINKKSLERMIFHLIYFRRPASHQLQQQVPKCGKVDHIQRTCRQSILPYFLSRQLIVEFCVLNSGEESILYYQ